MFRFVGGVIGIASIILALSFFHDQARGLSIIFMVLAGLLLVTVPLTFLIPDTARERYLKERRAQPPPVVLPEERAGERPASAQRADQVAASERQ
jgi:hypothetical protein